MTRNNLKLRILNREAQAAVRRIAKGLVFAVSLLALADGVPAATGAEPVSLKPRQPAATRTYLDVNAWCADYRRGTPRTDPGEIKRLKVVLSDLAPGFKPGSSKDGIDLLAAYSEELESAHPDQLLAATYLALTSTVPITFDVVQRVNALLCVSSTRRFAHAVADTAEAERREMMH